MAEFYETSDFVLVKDKCSHCKGQGACCAGASGYSCKRCHEDNGYGGVFSGPHTGLPCYVCGGSGWVMKKIKKDT